VSQDVLDTAKSSLNQTLADARLIDGKRIAAALAGGAPAEQKPIVEGVARAIEEVVQEENRVFVGGTANLAAEPAFGQVETLQGIFEALEEQQKVVRLLAGGLEEETSVRIGGELPDDGLRACSVVMSSYTVGGTPLGTVGVIGPTRMDYTQAMAITRAVARTIQEQLEQISG
jgi:heat-inducible transcriptional repressor